jgi:hypothetical protein
MTKTAAPSKTAPPSGAVIRTRSPENTTTATTTTTTKGAGQLTKGGHPVVHGKRATRSLAERVAMVRLAVAGTRECGGPFCALVFGPRSPPIPNPR